MRYVGNEDDAAYDTRGNLRYYQNPYATALDASGASTLHLQYRRTADRDFFSDARRQMGRVPARLTARRASAARPRKPLRRARCAEFGTAFGFPGAPGTRTSLA